MPYKEDREYRNFQSFEIRAAEEGEEPSFLVEGYASTFEPYVLFEMDGIQYKEQILPDAFEGTDMSDVIFVKDHQGTVYARTKNGTLNLSTDTHGLKVTADLSKTAAARESYEEIRTGMYDQMSFAFVVDDEEYNTTTHLRTIRHIKKLYDTSFVSFPANPGTDISVSTRSRFEGYIEQEKAERLAEEKRLKEAIAKFNFEKEKSYGIKRHDS
jgi:hypothetical protein